MSGATLYLDLCSIIASSYGEQVMNSSTLSCDNTMSQNISCLVNEVWLRVEAALMSLPMAIYAIPFGAIDLLGLTLRVIYEHRVACPLALLKVYWIFFKIVVVNTLFPVIAAVNPHALFGRYDVAKYILREITHIFAEMPRNLGTLAETLGVRQDQLPSNWQERVGDWRSQIARGLEEEDEAFARSSSDERAGLYVYDTKNTFLDAFEDMLLIHFPEYQVNAAMGRPIETARPLFTLMYRVLEIARDQLIEEGYRITDFEPMCGDEFQALKRRMILVFAEHSHIEGDNFVTEVGDMRLFFNPTRSDYNFLLKNIVVNLFGLPEDDKTLLKQVLNGRAGAEGRVLRGRTKRIFDTIGNFLGNGVLDHTILPGMIQNPDTDFRGLFREG
jgi:hypothetical protein